MIADIRTQNMIIATTIILSLVAASSLVVSTNYFVGSFSLVTNLDVQMISLILSNFDPTNMTKNPSIYLTFNIKVSGAGTGDVTLTYLTASVALNGESFDYISLHKKILPDAGRLYPQYERNFTLAASIRDDLDKAILLSAEEDGNWTFVVSLTLFYYMFKSKIDSVRFFVFIHEGFDEGLSTTDLIQVPS